MDKINRGTLVDFLFPHSLANHNKKLVIYDDQSKTGMNQHHKNISSTAKQSNRPRCLRVNQMNSSVVIWDERILQKDVLLHESVSPQKNFNIKRIKDVKRLGVSIEKIVKMQLKKREKLFNFDCNRSFSIQNSKPIQKMIVNAQSKKRVQIDQNNIPSLHQQQDPLITQYLVNQKKQLKDSKYILSDTHLSAKDNNRNTLERILQAHDFSSKIDQSSKKCATSPRKNYSRRLQEHKKYQQMVQLQRKEILQLKKELSKNYAKPFSPPENISAYSYIIYEANAKKSKFLRKFSLKQEEKTQTRKTLLNSYKVVASLNSRCPVEIASLTKIMTCILALDLSVRFKLKINQQYMLIGAFEQNIGGTSANLRKGEIYSLEQLLYGLMLPSGNDASLAIAVWGGKIILKSQGQRKCIMKKKDCYQRFIVQMNKKADVLNMQKTKYANSHGLSNFQNKSCSFDLALLCQYAMNNPQFRQIVSCRSYQAVINMDQEQTIFLQQTSQNKESTVRSLQRTLQLQQMKDLSPTKQDYNEQQMVNQKFKRGTGQKSIRWQSPHQLLQSMPHLYIGIKTGITDTAGPCLSSCFQVKARRFIVIVLDCRTMKYRFKDTQNLRKWLFKKEQISEKQIIRSNQTNKEQYLESNG